MASSSKTNPTNEIEILKDLGFATDIPQGDSTAGEVAPGDSSELPVELAIDESEYVENPRSVDDPTEPVPGESEWSQRNRLPLEFQEEPDREDLLSLLQERLFYHPLAHQIKLDRYVRRLRLISF